MSQFYLGIDVAKETFDVALCSGEQSWRAHFANDPSGFGKLGRWLKKRRAHQVHACLEATGGYWQELSFFLHEEGHQVSVVNPKLIKRHAEALMQRNKTDREDALTIADYCAKHQPDLWLPPPPAYLELRAMVRHVLALKADRHRARSRRQSGIKNQAVLDAIDAQVDFLNQQIEELEARIDDHIDQNPRLKDDKQLLKSIPGIGDITAAVFLAEVTDVSRFSQAPELAAFAGLTPGQRYSGTSMRSTGHILKWGNSHLRAVLFMPAMSAHKWNPVIAALKERLAARGKSKMTINIAAMRKLLHLCYGVLKTRKPFDPHHTLNVPLPA